jgi:hypothetical protein
VNLEGKAIGLNIARAGRVTSYALTPEVITRVLHRLKADGKVGQASSPAGFERGAETV